MTFHNGHAYDSKSSVIVRKSRRARHCIHCSLLINPGEYYTKWRGYSDMPEHSTQDGSTPELCEREQERRMCVPPSFSAAIAKARGEAEGLSSRARGEEKGAGK